MSQRFTQDEAIARIESLTETRLVSFIQAEIVRPVQSEKGAVYRQVDLARLELMCELEDLFDLRDDALGMVMSLIDQLHQARRDLRIVLEAVETEPEALRLRIGEMLRQAQRDR